MLKVCGEEFKLRYPLLGFFVGVAAFPLCFIVAAFFSGGGHSEMSFRITFPYAMLCHFGGFQLLGSVLFFLQLPFYGLAAGLTLANDCFRWSVIGLAITHLLTALWLIALNFHAPG
ncbi:MAG TPA: hypothetical protein VEY11_16805 [Pyrinomonadaceae bacterium]|nr:hypothetical protein [Pyrinomonadaceae bacterium]